MNETPDYNRRQFLALAVGVATTGALATTLTGCGDAVSVNRELNFSTLDDAMRELDRLTQPVSLTKSTAWNWGQTLVHCAQSIEYSMTGFPQAKSKLFQRTVGAAAFEVFAWRGRMSHDLNEPIPGADSLDNTTDVMQAVSRLKRAVTGFQRYTEPLQPHFAYGRLSKTEYEQAHAMHLANHFSVFSQPG